MAELQQQLEDLQTQFAFQEDLLQTLDQQVSQQDREIQLLQQQLQALRALCLQLAEAVDKPSAEGGAAQLDERPPHY